MREYDLIVVGCGPAGATAARVAAENGLAVLVLEARKVVGRPLQCAELVPYLNGSLPADSVCQALTGMEFHVEGEIAAAVHAPGFMLNRPVFDQRLAKLAIRKGAHLRLGHRVQGIENGTVFCQGNGKETFRARVILGADGCRSVVARSLGASCAEFMVARQVSAPLRKPQKSARLFFERRYGSGYGWLFPKGKWANVGLGLPQACADRLDPELKRFTELLARKELIDSGGIRDHAKGAIPVDGPSKRLVSGCALLAGDAAGLTNPLTGAGLISALVSGEIAAKVTAEALRQGDLSRLARYEDEVRLALPMERFAEKRKRMLRAWDTKSLKALIEEAWIDGRS